MHVLIIFLNPFKYLLRIKLLHSKIKAHMKNITKTIKHSIFSKNCPTSVAPLIMLIILIFLFPSQNTYAADILPGVNPGSLNQVGAGLLSTGKAALSAQDQQKNATGSCDSTCDTLGATLPPTSNQTASFITRVQACALGYTGQKTQTRNQNPDGSFTSWVDSDTSLCVCSPTFQDSTQSCASPLSGSYVQRTPLLCSGNVSTPGAPSTISNNCFTPCAPAASQTQTLSCPSNYVGSGVTQQRDSSCPLGIGSNSSPQFGAWNTVATNCTYSPPAPVYPAGMCSAGVFFLPLSGYSGEGAQATAASLYPNLLNYYNPGTGWLGTFAFNPSGPNGQAGWCIPTSLAY